MIGVIIVRFRIKKLPTPETILIDGKYKHHIRYLVQGQKHKGQRYQTLMKLSTKKQADKYIKDVIQLKIFYNVSDSICKTVNELVTT